MIRSFDLRTLDIHGAHPPSPPSSTSESAAGQCSQNTALVPVFEAVMHLLDTATSSV